MKYIAMVTVFKTRILIIITICTLIFTNCDNPAPPALKESAENHKKEKSLNSHDSLEIKDEAAIKRLRDFYKEYIAFNSAELDEVKSNKIKRKYLTKKMLQKLKKEAYDADPLVNAQDYDAESIKTLSVTKDSSPDTYIIQYMDLYSKQYIQVKVKMEDNQIMIDSVL